MLNASTEATELGRRNLMSAWRWRGDAWMALFQAYFMMRAWSSVGREAKEWKTDAGSSMGSVGCDFCLPCMMLDFGMFEAVSIIVMVLRAVMIEE